MLSQGKNEVCLLWHPRDERTAYKKAQLEEDLIVREENGMVQH